MAGNIKGDVRMTSWFFVRIWLSRTFQAPGRARRRPQSQTPGARRRIPLVVERLEDRTLFTVSHIVGFDGISNTGFYPPDTNGAAGPSSYIESVNTTLAMYDKTTGVRIAGPTSFGSFFAPLGGELSFSDPVVIYNEVTQRYGIGILDFSGSACRLDFAISNTSNPTTLTSANWSFARFNTNDGVGGFNLSDYPKIGYNADGFVLSFNMFVNSQSFTHSSTLSITNALTSPGITVVPGGTSHFTLAPAAMHSASPGDPMWFVEASGGSSVRVDRMDNPFDPLPVHNFTTIAVPAYGSVPNARQPGPSINTSQLGSRFYFSDMQTVSGVTHLVTAHMAGAGGGVQAQWLDIRVSGAPGLVQSGFINQGTGIDTYIPDAAMSPDGSIGMTFIESSSSEFMSVYVTGRKATDALGTMQTPILAKAGVAALNPSSRIGDYSTTSIDPVDGTFWSANEYAGAGGNWRTFVEHFTLMSVATPPVVSPPSDQAGTEGLSGTFDLGSFVDPDSSPYSVDVDWGDGTAHTTFSQGTDGALGTQPHTYAEEGSMTVTVTVTNSANQSDAKTFTINVADANLTATGTTLNETTGVTFTDTVATFTDDNPALDVGDFSAVVDWGDGSTPVAEPVSLSGTTFSVANDGTFSYASAGTYTVTVTITDVGGSSTSTTSTITVTDGQAPRGGGRQPVVPVATDTPAAGSGIPVNKTLTFDSSQYSSVSVSTSDRTTTVNIQGSPRTVPVTLIGRKSDDVLIGAATAYDTKAGLVSLQAIMNYWSTTADSYATGVSNVTNGAGVPLLDATEVTNNGGGSTMTGDHGGIGELKLVYGLDLTMQTTDYNSSAGEQVINC
jgi:hypothetical protein